MRPARHKNPLPFLATLAGCVFMLAWVHPANATEVTRQLTQKGYAVSQLRKSEVAIVKNSHRDIQVFFKGCVGIPEADIAGSYPWEFQSPRDYQAVFPNYVKSVLKADIRTWLKRE